MRSWLRAVRYLVLEGCCGLVSLALLVPLLFWAALLILGPGWLVARPMVGVLRWWSELGRRRAGGYRGAPVITRYPPLPPVTSLRGLAAVVLSRGVLRDGTWVVLHGVLTPPIAIFTIAFPIAAINAFVVPAYWWALPPDEPVNNLFPVTSWWTAAAMPVVGLAYVAVSVFGTPAAARGISGLAYRFLGIDTRTRLAERVEELTDARAAAFDAHAAELRRIERDLHDGAQNRLVAVVMMLGLAERSAQTNPGQVLPQLLKARDAATEALAGLRTVVHDIYPPILDELGLDGAASALAGRCPIPCILDASGLRRAPTAVESAAYFIIAEAITNAVKHSGAQHITIRLDTATNERGEVLAVHVTDDGGGGARIRDDGGIAGIVRRIAAFEGTVDLSSPQGGPTVLRVELPCGY